MIDQSRSMKDEISAGGTTQQKATGVADTINRWLQELSLKCAKSEGIGDYYHVGVIGYGKKVGPAFVGQIAGRDLVPISEIAENPGRVEERVRKIPDGQGGFTEQPVNVPIWFDPVANGGTPMCGAANEAYRVLQDWLPNHADSYPPVVIHITDGEATDGDPQQRVRCLRDLSTSDGETMLFNIHLSANPNATPVIFPDSADNLPDEYSRMLFESASLLTDKMHAIAKEHRIPTTKNSRAFVLNADMVLLVQAIDIGTRPANAAMDHPVVMVEPATAEPATQQFQEDPVMQELDSNDPVQDDAVQQARAREEAAASAGSAASAPATGGKTTVRLSVLATGKLVEASIELDKKGRIVNVLPAVPLDAGTEYRLGPGQ
ncbi:MAG: vWA domain-containing protein [Planctomycetota bacterium]